ncbi:MAG: ABC transporter substrate-binding protein [Tissierellia bacterium]|nr:ABC transporter substrate-binding protein [Tissierellia bacterium]
MNKYFDVKDKVYDITEKYPETIEVFVANGFQPLANEKMRKLMGKTISLEMACKSKKVNLEIFTEKLIEAIEQNRNSVDSTLITKKENLDADIKLEGILPCPVRVPLLEGFNTWIEENKEILQLNIEYDLKSAHMGVSWLREKVESGNEDSLADLYLSAGFDLFFDKNLMGKFKEDGVFEDITDLEKLNEDFDNEELDLKDPERHYSILGVVPAVFMVNTEELRGRDFPKSWEDLLKPEFEASVSIPTMDNDLFNAILLNIYKKYGEEGIRKLAKAQFRSMHPAEMVKSHIRKNNSTVPTVTIMPYFFTNMVRPDSPLKTQWPEDGAIISPIFLLAKKKTKEKTKAVVDYIFSREVGELLSNNGKFPTTIPGIDNKLSPEQKFIWLGWDYIKSNNIGGLIDKCMKLFYEVNQEE